MREERRDLPRPVHHGILVEVDHLVVAGVLPLRSVDHDRDEPGHAAAVGHRGRAALVRPGEPARHPEPVRAPAAVVDLPVGVEVAADAEEALVLAARPVDLDRVVDLHDDEVSSAVVVEIGDGHAAARVEPREPARHVPPLRPAADAAVDTEVVTDPVEAPVQLVGIVDHEDNEVAPALRVGTGDGDARALVPPGEPVGDIDPRRPTGDSPVGPQAAADAVEPAVLLRAVVDHEDDQVAATVPAQVGDGDVGARIGPGEPVGNVDPRRPAALHTVAGEPSAEPVDPAVLLRAVVDHEYDEMLLAGQVGHRDAGTLVLPGEPVGNGEEVLGHCMLLSEVSDVPAPEPAPAGCSMHRGTPSRTGEP